MIRERSSGRPLHPLLSAGLLGLLALLAVAGVKSYRDLSAARAHEARLETEIRRVEERSERLARRIELLQTDPVTLEREVRRSLRWVRPGEITLVIDEDETAPAAVRADGEPPAAAADGS